MDCPLDANPCERWRPASYWCTCGRRGTMVSQRWPRRRGAERAHGGVGQAPVHCRHARLYLASWPRHRWDRLTFFISARFCFGRSYWQGRTPLRYLPRVIGPRAVRIACSICGRAVCCALRGGGGGTTWHCGLAPPPPPPLDRSRSTHGWCAAGDQPAALPFKGYPLSRASAPHAGGRCMTNGPRLVGSAAASRRPPAEGFFTQFGSTRN